MKKLEPMALLAEQVAKMSNMVMALEHRVQTLERGQRVRLYPVKDKDETRLQP